MKILLMDLWLIEKQWRKLTLFEIEIIPINEQIQNIAQKKDTLCRRMYN